jgi:hypothetical protein
MKNAVFWDVLLCRITRRHITEDGILHSLQVCIVLFLFLYNLLHIYMKDFGWNERTSISVSILWGNLSANLKHSVCSFPLPIIRETSFISLSFVRMCCFVACETWSWKTDWQPGWPSCSALSGPLFSPRLRPSLPLVISLRHLSKPLKSRQFSVQFPLKHRDDWKRDLN